MDKKKQKLASILIFIIFALIGSYFLHFFLPQKDIFEISGINAKRIDGSSKNEDSFYVYTKKNDTVLTFCNNDTGFRFPLYFKFNSSELQAEAQQKTGKKVVLKYYGRRNKILKTFPNILNITDYQEGMSTTSWTRNIIFTLWFVLLIFLFPRFYSLLERKHPGVNPAMKHKQIYFPRKK